MRIGDLLPRGSSRRTAVIGGGLILAAFVVTKVGLPQPTPNGVLLLGTISGCANALLAAGIVLLFRSSRTINFAQGALGLGGAAFLFNLRALVHWPFLLALLAGIVVAVALGVLVELLFVRRFFEAPRLVLTVVTIVLATVLVQARALIDRLPFWPDLTPAVAEVVLRGEVALPFAGWDGVEVFPFRFRSGQFAAWILTVVALAALGAFLRFTRLGVRIRASSENAQRALLLGVNVKLLSTVVWGIAGGLSGLAAITTGLSSNFNQVTDTPQLLIPALAAAVIARVRSLPVAIVSAISIAVVRSAILWSYPGTTLLDVGMLGVIAAGLLAQRRGASGVDEGLASSWEATKEIRPTPKELTGLASIRVARRALLVVGAVVAVVLPFAMSPAQTNLAALIAINAIIALSLVILTGWGGQVSLGQFALVAVAAVVGGKLAADTGVPFWIVAPLVSAGSAAFATVVGLPALRIRGAFLAVTTLAFAVAVQSVLFDETFFGWLLPERVERPSLFLLHFGNERNFYYLTVASCLLVAIVVKRLRASRPGRVFIALREDELGVQTFKINATRTRLAAFALSGALAGFAGVLMVHHQRAVDPESYIADVSVRTFIMAMIGGVTSVTGALLGASYVGLVEYFVTDPIARQLTSSVGLLVLLLVAPGGLASIAYAGRDAVLRVIATRRQIIVPSLFEDYDPEALARRKLPIGAPIPRRGAEALGPRRYALESPMYPRRTARRAGAAS